MNIVDVGVAQRAPVGSDVTRGNQDRSREPDGSGEQWRVGASSQPEKHHRRRGQHAATDKDRDVDASEMLPEVIGEVKEIRRQKSCR